MKYLISQTDTYRVDTVAEVEQLHQELKNSNDFVLSAFSYKTKPIKIKQIIVSIALTSRIIHASKTIAVANK